MGYGGDRKVTTLATNTQPKQAEHRNPKLKLGQLLVGLDDDVLISSAAFAACVVEEVSGKWKPSTKIEMFYP